MAHECPDCYETCHCGGDMDDMLMNGTKEEIACGHCPMHGGFDDESHDDDNDGLTR